MPDLRAKFKQAYLSKEMYLMLLPAVLYLIIFVFYPIVKGVTISLQDFTFINDSKFIGFDNYQRMLFQEKDFWRAFQNTLIFAFWNAFLGVVLPCLLSIMLCELRGSMFKKFTQTMLYLPNLFSWVIVGSTFMFLLSPTVGPVNYLVKIMGNEPIYFFGKPEWARTLIIFLNQWKITGFGIIIYLATLVGIPPEQYEAAEIDGANRFQKVLYVTIPSLKNTVKVMIMLNIMGMFLLFDPIYVLQNPITMQETDVLMTYIYRTSITKLDLSYGAAVSVFISVIALVMTLIAKKLTGYGIEND